jgi:DNA polymerase-3 subunit delta'
MSTKANPEERGAAALLPWLQPPLAQALGSKLGHAILIHGPRGVGQFELALAVAAAWLCEAELPSRPPDGRACGECAACRLIAARTHPDLKVVVPPVLQESLGWIAEDETSDGEGAKSKAKPSKEIKVEAARATVEFAQQTASRGKGKVVVIYPAERMNPTAANMLLKTLEEPPGATRFLLASAAPQRLLPTVRSRCQSLALPVPASEVATAWLAELGVDRPEVMLAAAGGSPIEALERAQQFGIDAPAWEALPAAVLAGRTSTVSAWPLSVLIDALQKLCHDLLCVAVGAPPRYFPRKSLPAGAGDVERLAEGARDLAAAARHAEHPWHAALACEALVQGVAQAAGTPERAGSARPALTTLNR